MAIVARQQKELTEQEQAAFVKFFKENPALGESESADCTFNAKEMVKYLADTWKVIVDQESLAAGFKALSDAGQLRLKSAAKLRWESVSKGVQQQTLDALDQEMRRCHLVTDGDAGFENKASLLGYLQGREVTTANIQRGAQYLSGSKGVRLHWAARPSQNPPQDRGHKATSPQDYRFAPKEDTNVGLARHSHASDPRFNGEAEREKREAERRRFNRPDDDPLAAHNYVWRQMMDKAIAEGRTHSERNRIAQVAQQTPGGVRLQAEAAQREAALIRQDRERGR